ncbi:MAG: nuclear transport factor 2 family protein [Pyrinomonadaceae bacterium]
MKILLALCLIASCSLFSVGQEIAKKIYDTEKAFARMVAGQGINAGIAEFLAPDGVMFVPEAANARQWWKSQPASPVSLTWNPIWIDVSSNGALAYSIGNSVYRAKGKDDPTAFYGHYISIWSRQMNGEYRAVLDAGINHEKPVSTPIDWKSPADIVKEKNAKKISAADSAVGFYQTAEQQGSDKAYKEYLADDVYLLRDGKQPFIGKKAALEFLKQGKSNIKFARRKSFIEAADLAHVFNIYTITNKTGTKIERGNFVQVWKLRGEKWQIVADVFVPIPKSEK